MNTPKVTFNTSEYVWSAGKEPRGFGCWWFEANGKQYQFHGKYSDAKRSCNEAVKMDNPNNPFVTVKVLS